MLRKWLSVFRKVRVYRQSLHSKSQLDSLFSVLTPAQTLEESALWLVRLAVWLRDDDSSAEQWPARSRFLFQVLERNPEWNKNFQLLIPRMFSQIQILDLLCESGLPLEQGLWSELWDRIFAQVLPHKPLLQDSGLFLSEMFPSGTDLETLETTDLLPWIQLLADSTRHLQSDLDEAFAFLISQSRAMALHPSLRKRMQGKRMRDLCWYSLTSEAEQFLQTRNADKLNALLENCRLSIESIYNHLQEFGVSTDLVFRLEKLKLFLSRIHILIPVLQNPSESSVKALWIHLIDLNQKKRGVRALYRQSSQLLSQKIVEKNSETGDHYIARNFKEGKDLFGKAAGGGFLTAFTVYAKIWLLSISLSPFLTGFFASLNYSFSFLLIQMLGWTLATKQPANTATTIASQLQDLHRPEKLKQLSDEVFFLFRSQCAAVFGNILLVIPTSLALTYAYWWLTGEHILTHDQAHHNLQAVTGWTTLLFAAWTGVLLWLSSIIAGWVDNWFAYREVFLRIQQNTTLRRAISPQAAEKSAHWVKHQIPSIASNVSLGFLLGLSPEILRFFGIPLEVRHVTLSTGSLAASIPVLGMDFLQSWDLLWAILGILCIGALNLGVSFWLAFNVAMKAQKVNKTQKRRIYKALLERIF
jgi:site-specific recombinase